MSYLVDTNVLLRIAQKTSPQHTGALRAAATLRRRGEELCVVPQNLIEYWAVATRPVDKNGFGLTVTQASQEHRKIRRFFTLYPDTPAIFSEWENLVTTYHVAGKNAHDARLIAAMIVHRISHILTFNTDDFKRFPDITVVDPRTV
jgi:predicted nucleic acid-binding protein